MEDAIRAVRDHLVRADPGGVLSVSLFGSAAVGGLRPDSDIDMLVLTRHSLSRAQRQDLVEVLLRYSGRRATVAPGRPLEVTVLLLGDVVPWTYPPMCDLLYGEWRREEFLAGRLPERHPNPDVAVLVTTSRQHAVALVGPPPQDVLAPVPPADLRRAIQDSLPPLLDDLPGDERNVLLTLARMVVTLESGRILPKDAAAQLLLPDLDEPDRAALSLAARGYVGEVDDDWTDRQAQARHTATVLAAQIRAHGS